MNKGQKMSKESRRKLSESCKGRIAWNKGLTKKDSRVAKYALSEGSKKTQFKKGIKKYGKDNSNWKGGKIIHQGYVYIRDTNHPYNKNGYVQEHRLVVEKEIGRFLEPNEIIHHINEDTEDNNLENLEKMFQKEHIILHINNKTD